MKESKHLKLSIEITRIRNDLVFSPCDLPSDQCTYTPALELLALRKYEEYFAEFYKSGASLTRQCIIKRTCQEWQFALKMNFHETYKIVNSVSGTLLLNEIELTYWSILLRYKNEGVDPILFAYFSAFLAKANLNCDILPFEVYLNSCIPNFKLHFYNWQMASDCPTEVSMQTLHQRYKQLVDSAGKELKNYDLLVEQLMQVPRRKESGMSESWLSDKLPSEFDGSSIEDFGDLLQEARHSPIDKFED